jgi:hypothetical protein
VNPRQVARDEQDRGTRRVVDPLQVVDDDQHRTPGGKGGENTEGRHAHCKAIDDAVGFVERKRSPECRGLRRRDLGEIAFRGTEELCENGKRKVRVRFAPRGAKERELSLAAFREIVEEHGLADAWLAGNEQRGAVAMHGSLSESVECRTLPLATDEHSSILIDRGAKT